jgi:hypothetical protein
MEQHNTNARLKAVRKDWANKNAVEAQPVISQVPARQGPDLEQLLRLLAGARTTLRIEVVQIPYEATVSLDDQLKMAKTNEHNANANAQNAKARSLDSERFFKLARIWLGSVGAISILIIVLLVLARHI